MSYEKHTWETGETITAEKLNNLEDGVASGGGGGSTLLHMIVNFDYIDDEHGYSVFDKTLREVHEAFIRGQIVLVGFEPEYESVSRNEVCLVDISSGFIKFYNHSTDTNAFLYADSLDGYLHSQGED